MSEYVPDSPTSVASSGPWSPQWDPLCDEDFTVPYWGCHRLELEESAARYRILLCESTEIYSEREAVQRMLWRTFLDEEIAARHWIQSVATEAFVYLDARRSGLHP